MKTQTGIYDTVIIGGGPAGLFTALNIVNQNVLLIEKGERPGRKLLISGTGQCNFTHSGSISAFTEHYGTGKRFIKNAVFSYTNLDLINFFRERGVDSIEDQNGKIFPASLKAYDILNVLLDSCEKNKIRILSGSPVIKVEGSGEIFKVTTSSNDYQCKHLVIATGGLSYPSTGSTGDGYRFAEMLGHRIVSPKPALSPVIIQNYKFASLTGISLTNLKISLYHENKKTADHRGDIVFTLKGISGPGILDFSRLITAGDVLRINFTDDNPDKFAVKFIQAAKTNGGILLQTWLKPYNLPKNLLRFLIGLSGLNPDRKIAEIPKAARVSLIELLCDHPFMIEKVGGFKTAMATAGGVSLNEVSSKTMESKLVRNLYFAGEVLDIDGDTGGYNLQAAFSTAFLAAKAINSGGN